MEEHRDHKPNSFTPVVVALRLAEYTIKITENPKTFPPTRTSDDGTIAVVAGGCLTEWVRELSKRIFVLAYTANRINVPKEPDRKDERLRKQREALDACAELLAAIQILSRHYHLDKKRVRYWSSLANELERAIEGWNESDKERFREI